VKLTRRGGLRLRLEPAEISVLTALLTQLDATLAGENPDDPVVQRLYPSAYRDDADAAAEYRSITESGLRSDRLTRAQVCAAELGREIDLSDPVDGTRWIQVLNDLRLVLGTRLGVTEDDPEFDPADPAEQARLVYHWLTGVQDAVVQALMG
jgi:plasmid stability protein